MTNQTNEQTPSKRTSTIGRKLFAGTTLAIIATSLTAMPAQALKGGVPLTEAPSWAAAVLRADGSAGCTGTLIDEEWVLTAFHCLANEIPTSVRIGSPDKTDGGEVIGVETTIAHPEAGIDWELGRITGPDLALLKLERPATGTPLPLGSADDADDPANLAAFGWGYLDWDATPTNILHRLDIEGDELTDCASGEPLVQRVCLSRADGSGILPGDSGGPLVAETADGAAIVGVAVAARPGESVWVDLTAYTDWVEDALAS